MVLRNHNMNQLTQDDISAVEDNIKSLAADPSNNWIISNNITRIAKAKLRFFGLTEWHRCPCYPPDDTIHGCGTEACAEQIKTDGKCHCNLYLRRD